MPRHVIAAFDFDNTITTKDTLFDFLRFSFGFNKLMIGLLSVSPFLLLNKFKILSNASTKEKLLTHFLKGMDIARYKEICNEYAAEIDRKLNVKAIDKMNWHKAQGHEIIIISASVEDWIIPWAGQRDIQKVLATQMEFSNGLLTGRFKSKNCNGIEKVNRLLENFPDRNQYYLYAYGDSAGDNELLLLADYKFLRMF